MKLSINYLLLALIFMVVPANAFSFEVDNFFYELENGSNDNVIITGARTVYGSMDIPGEVTYDSHTYHVVGIANNAFSRSTYLTDVTIHENIITIGERAFEKCYKLQSVILPNSLVSIEDYCFYDSSSLESISIGTGLRHIGKFAFDDCYLLTVNIADLASWCEIDFDENVYDGAYQPGDYQMDSNPLRGASLLLNGTEVKNLVIPNTVTEIKANAFYGCQSITSVSIPASVTSIGDYAFYQCWNLADVSGANSVTNIPKNAFRETQWLVYHPEGVVYIGRVAYSYVGFADLEIKNGTISIADGAFCFFHGSNVEIPNTVKHIGEAAFQSTYISSIVIPNSVETIGNMAFSFNEYLEKAVIGNSVKVLPKGAFLFCWSLTDVTFGNHLMSIGENCFLDCEQLKELSFPASIRYIGDDAFKGTPWLYTLPNGLNYVGTVAYRYCGTMPTSDYDIVIKDGTTQIAGEAFYNYPLRSIVLPNSVEVVGQHSFEECNNLSNITCYATAPPQTLESVWNTDYEYFKATVHVPKRSLMDYQADEWWKCFKKIVAIEIPGDLNSDGELTLADVNVLIINIIIGSSYNPDWDLDHDGELTLADVNILIDMLLRVY